MSASTVMGIAFFFFQISPSFFCLIQLLSLHRLVKIHQMAVKLRSVHTGKFYFIPHSQTAGARTCRFRPP